MSADVEAAVVRIRSGDSVVGAGFLAGPNRILTCAHVVADALGLREVPAEPPGANVDVDFPLVDGPPFQASVVGESWRGIDDTGRGDVAGLLLTGEPPAGVKPVAIQAADDVFNHPFRTFGFPQHHDAGVWSTGRLLGRQAAGHLQLEDDKTTGHRVEEGFSGAPIWDERLRAVVGMTVTSERAAELKVAYCIPAAYLLAAWPGLDSGQPSMAADAVVVGFAEVDRAWADWVAAELERGGVPAMLAFGDIAGEGDIVAVVSPAFTAAESLEPRLAVRVRAGGPLPSAAAFADLVGRDDVAARAVLADALAASGLAKGRRPGPPRATPPPFPPTLEADLLEAGVRGHRRHLRAAGERAASGRRRVAGRPPISLHSYFRNRVDERARIRELVLDPTTRLVTVIGRGGMGKTAAACQVLDDLESEELADGRLAGLLYFSPRTNAVTLDAIIRLFLEIVDESARASLTRVLLNQDAREKADGLLVALGNGPYVVFIDNAEDLLSPEGVFTAPGLAALVDRVVDTGGPIRILLTTREPLVFDEPSRLRYDNRVRLEAGLPTPDGIEVLRELDPNDEYGLRRASDEELAAAVERLHGVPRALELLASLAATDGGRLERLLDEFFEQERVVERLVANAYAGLDEESRIVLVTLATYTRPVPPAAVTAVVAPLVPGLEVERVLRRLARLYLVTLDDDDLATLHPIDREYARSMLPEDGPRGRRALERAAAAYWAQVRVERAEWRGAIDVDAHLLQFEHLLNAGDVDAAADVLSEVDGHRLAPLWLARRLLAYRKELEGRLADPRRRLQHAYGLGQIYAVLGPANAQREMFEQSLSLARELGEGRYERDSLSWLGETNRRLGNQELAFELTTRAAELHHEAGERSEEAYCLAQASFVEAYRQRHHEALELGRRALELSGGTGHAAAMAHDALSLAHYELDQLDDAEARVVDALRLYEAEHSPTATFVLNVQGMIRLKSGDFPRAIEVLERGRTWTEEIGILRLLAYFDFNLAHAYLAVGDAATAESRAEAAAETLVLVNEERPAEGARALARAARARAGGDDEAASAALAESRRLSLENPDLYDSP